MILYFSFELGIQHSCYLYTKGACLQNPTQCKLVLPYGALDKNCASGVVFPYENGLIHSLPLRENHHKVLIEKINKDFQGLPIPVVTDEVSNLQNAVGQIIQWPRNAIILTQVHIFYP